MTNDPGYLLTPDAAQAVAGAVRFGRRFSREGMNNTPAPRLPYTPSVTAVWPVKVTGDPTTVDPETGDVSSAPGAVPLYPAVWLLPNAPATGFEEQDEVWLLPFPGTTPKAGDVVMGRLGGQREADGLAVYVGAAPPPAGGIGDVIGPDHVATGSIAVFTDPSGRFIGPTPDKFAAVVMLTAFYSVVADNTWEDTGLEIDLPSAGKYFLYADVLASIKVSAITASIGAIVLVRFTVDGTSTGGIEYPFSYFPHFVACQTTQLNQLVYAQTTPSVTVKALRPVKIKLQTYRGDGSPAPTWVSCRIESQTPVAANTATLIGYQKIN